MSTSLYYRHVNMMIRSGELKQNNVDIAISIANELSAGRLTEQQAIDRLKLLARG